MSGDRRRLVGREALGLGKLISDGYLVTPNAKLVNNNMMLKAAKALIFKACLTRNKYYKASTDIQHASINA